MLTSKNQLARYGSQGTLKIPQDNGTFDPDTGDVNVLYDTYPVLYVPFPVATDDLNNFGLSAFTGSFMTFMFTNEDIALRDIPTTGFITDTDNKDHDLYTVQRLLIKDNIVLFQAKTKAGQ